MCDFICQLLAGRYHRIDTKIFLAEYGSPVEPHAAYIQCRAKRHLYAEYKFLTHRKARYHIVSRLSIASNSEPGGC